MSLEDTSETLCDAEVLSLTPSNPEHYEFYELCFSNGSTSEAELKTIDPTLYCGVSGIFAGCKADAEIGCHGDLVYDTPGSDALSADCWSTLCTLSHHPGVRTIAGGYWL